MEDEEEEDCPVSAMRPSQQPTLYQPTNMERCCPAEVTRSVSLVPTNSDERQNDDKKNYWH